MKETTPTKPPAGSREKLLILAAALLVFLLYSNALNGPFILDDIFHIPKNPHIRLEKLTFGGLWGAAFNSPSPRRPLANASFAVNYRLHQNHVFGYHLVNVLIHIAAGTALYFLLKTTLHISALPAKVRLARWIPLFAASLWMVHPLQTQSVSYIVQRMNSLAALFFVLTLLLYARARLAQNPRLRAGLYAVCLICSLLALGSKENAALLPFFVVLYEWYFFQDLSRIWLARRWWVVAGMFSLFAAAALLFLGPHPVERILADYNARDFNLSQRVLTQFPVVVHYISLLMLPLPARLNLDHDFPLSHSLTEPAGTLLSALLIFGLLVLAVRTARRQRFISFCILWFFGNLVVESSVIGLEIIFEHRVYLPSMFFCAALFVLVFRYVKPDRLAMLAVCAAVAVCSAATYQRNSLWSDEISLLQDCVSKSPGKTRARNNLGLALYKKGRIDASIEQFREVLRIEPEHAKAHNNLGLALEKAGRIEEALKHYREALRINPKYADAHSNLGLALAGLGRTEAAIDRFEKALRIYPDLTEARNSLGHVLYNLGRIDEAAGHYRLALRVDPNYAAAHNNLGLALARQGNIDEAVARYRKALEIDPAFVEAHNNLGLALAGAGRIGEAAGHFRRALQSDPNYAEAHNNLGIVLAQQGRIEGAVLHFKQALQADPGYARAHNNLGIALFQKGDVEGAVGHFREAVRLNPGDVSAKNHLEKALAAPRTP